MGRVRRGRYLVILCAPQVLAYVAWPLAVARGGRRHGWVGGRPGPTNLLGILPLATGTALIGWAALSHARARGSRSRVTLIPDYLVTTGAYSVSRDPLYLGGAPMWLGWSTLLGNVRVAAVGSGWLLMVSTFAIPLEERILRERFGDAYEAFADRVPRWIDLSLLVRKAVSGPDI